MNVLKISAVCFIVLSACLMLLGLARPWVVLWWQPVQTRRKVIKVYGAIIFFAVVFYVVVRMAD